MLSVNPIVVLSLLASAAFAQTQEANLKSRIERIRYPILGEQARIQGDVLLTINSGEVTILSGHRLLARSADESVKTLAPLLHKMPFDVTFHFVLADTPIIVATPTTIKKGNMLERAFLRTLGFSTEKVVVESRCEDRTPPPNTFKLADAAIEILIYGRSRCLQPQVTTY